MTVGRPKALLAYSASDPNVSLVVEHLLASCDVVSTQSALIESPRQLGLRAVLPDADVLVGLLTPRGVSGRSEIMFELGIALGVGRPVLVLGAQQRPPRILRDVPFLSIEAFVANPSVLLDSLRRALGDGAVHANRAATNIFDVSSDLLGELGEPANASLSALTDSSLADLEGRVAKIFVAAGAQVRAADSPSSDRALPDFLVWDDSLFTSFGLPLAVEIAPSGAASSRWDRYRSRLRNSGSQSLLVVRSQAASPKSWTDGLFTILEVSIEDLDKSLQSRRVESALESLLAESVRAK